MSDLNKLVLNRITGEITQKNLNELTRIIEIWSEEVRKKIEAISAHVSLP